MNFENAFNQPPKLEGKEDEVEKDIVEEKINQEGETFEEENKNEDLKAGDNEEESDYAGPNVSRRDFLKTSVALAGLTLAKMAGIEVPEVEAREKKEKPGEIYSAHKIFEKPAGEREFGVEQMKAINAYWGNFFEKTGVVGRGAERMAPHVGGLEKQFIKAGMPKDLLYMPIIESGARNAQSPVGALGPWQIMPFNIPNGVNHSVVETIPGGAKYALQVLKHKERVLGKVADPDDRELLLLAGYNGGFMDRYAEETRTSNMPDFMQFMEYRANRPGCSAREKSGIIENINHIHKYMAMLAILGKDVPELNLEGGKFVGERSIEAQKRKLLKDPKRRDYPEDVIDYLAGLSDKELKKWLGDEDKHKPDLFFADVRREIDKGGRDERIKQKFWDNLIASGQISSDDAEKMFLETQHNKLEQ